MRKLFVFMFLILSVGFVVAHGYSSDYVFKEKISESEYFPHENRVVTTTTYIDYENENRFSTYDYRHGYSYRATREYRDSYKVKSYVKNDYVKSYSGYSNWDEKKIYYYKDVPHMRGFVKRSCYDSAPRGKLFYIKC